MRYLVHAADGPSFTSVKEMLPVLENLAVPGLEALARLEENGTILAGGLPVGERALAFIIEAPSHEELDAMLQKIPLWGLLSWKVTPLQSFQARAAHERTVLARAKKSKP